MQPTTVLNSALTEDDDVCKDNVKNKDEPKVFVLTDKQIINECPEKIDSIDIASTVIFEGETVNTDTNSGDDEQNDDGDVRKDFATALPNMGTSLYSSRHRKHSLDCTILSRRQSWSQPDIHLHSAGKSPLERKSSFFRKKLDSFLKNTSEIFKRKSGDVYNVKCKHSASFSIESLHKMDQRGNLEAIMKNTTNTSQNVKQANSVSNLTDSQSSLASAATSRISILSSQTSLGDKSIHGFYNSQPLTEVNSQSTISLCDGCGHNLSFESRAMSFSSGLNNVDEMKRRMAKRANRIPRSSSDVTRLASSSSMSTFPRAQTKGRKLSYQRAVSGEDPVYPARFLDTKRRSKAQEMEGMMPTIKLRCHNMKKLIAELLFCLDTSLRGPVSERSLELLEMVHKDNSMLTDLCIKVNTENVHAQMVLVELMTTEMEYIYSLHDIESVYLNVAKSLHNVGYMTYLDVGQLFLNIRDVIDTALRFWEQALVPMIEEALQDEKPFDIKLMYSTFCHIHELFRPYKKFVSEHFKISEYYQTLKSRAEFSTFIGCCNNYQRERRRFYLKELLMKPTQRITKYSLLLLTVVDKSKNVEEKQIAKEMNTYMTKYVTALNKYTGEVEEMEKMDRIIRTVKGFDYGFHNEQMDVIFRSYNSLNLDAPMPGCMPHHSRSLIHEGDVCYRDTAKDVRINVRLVLLTDTLLICKKLSHKLFPFEYELIRPKYMIRYLKTFLTFKTSTSKRKSTDEAEGLIVLLRDELGSSLHSFWIHEVSKRSPESSIKIWHKKFKEASLSYQLELQYAANPSIDVSEIEICSTVGEGSTEFVPENESIEKQARKRLHEMILRPTDTSIDGLSQASLATDSCEGEASSSGAARQVSRNQIKRKSSGGSSHTSRVSSFQHSNSATSHDEPQAGPSKYHFRCGSSVEHTIHPPNPGNEITSITVNVMVESESETLIGEQSPNSSMLRSPISPASIKSHNMLCVQPQSGAKALVHSLPNLTQVISSLSSGRLSPQSIDRLSPNEASGNKHLLSVRPRSAQGLTSDRRGASYPPPSPTRSLKRGFAFSHSIKNPPLSKMGHVGSQSTVPFEPVPSTIKECDTSSKPLTDSAALLNMLCLQPHSRVKASMQNLPTLTTSERSGAQSLDRLSLNESSEKKQLLSVRPRSAQGMPSDLVGARCPPPSPTRSLKRGLAFSHSIKNPPLAKVGHVGSQYPVTSEPVPSTSKEFEKSSKSDKSSTKTGKIKKKTSQLFSRFHFKDKSLRDKEDSDSK